MPQHRNTANRIFGGFLMHRAYEAAFCAAFMFGGSRPRFSEIDEVHTAGDISIRCDAIRKNDHAQIVLESVVVRVRAVCASTKTRRREARRVNGEVSSLSTHSMSSYCRSAHRCIDVLSALCFF